MFTIRFIFAIFIYFHRYKEFKLNSCLYINFVFEYVVFDFKKMTNMMEADTLNKIGESYRLQEKY